jgi:hypothetical protein
MLNGLFTYEKERILECDTPATLRRDFAHCEWISLQRGMGAARPHFFLFGFFGFSPSLVTSRDLGLNGGNPVSLDYF